MPDIEDFLVEGTLPFILEDVDWENIGGIDLDLDLDLPLDVQNNVNLELDANSSASGNMGISFKGGNYTNAERDSAKSKLKDQLDSDFIYDGNLYQDSIWGGLDNWSGEQVYQAINRARNNGKISDSKFHELISLLGIACKHQ